MTKADVADAEWPIFVISLIDAEARRQAIAAGLAAMNLDFSFVTAIDGRKGLPAQYEKMIDRPQTLARRGYPMSDGEYACALSHQMVYRRIIDEGLPGAIILEDDVTLTDEFASFMKHRAYRRHHLIQLFHFHAKVWRHGTRQLFPDVQIRGLSENAFMAAGYSLSARGADYMVRNSSPISERADWPCDVTRIKAVITIPRLVMHPDPDSEQSSLSKGRANLVPEGFDYSWGHAKGWRRLITPASWRSFARNRLSEVLHPGF